MSDNELNQPSSSLNLEIDHFKDGALVLSMSDMGMESDLVFASGAMAGDPLLSKQRRMLEELKKGYDFYLANDKGRA